MLISIFKILPPVQAWRPVTRRNFFQWRGNENRFGIVVRTDGLCRHHNRLFRFRRNPSMTISTRIALGVSAATLSLGLALAPAFAMDNMKKDSMSK